MLVEIDADSMKIQRGLRLIKPLIGRGPQESP